MYRYWYEGIYLAQNHINNNGYGKILYISPDYDKKPTGQTIVRPADWNTDLPSTVPNGVIKIVYYKKEISDWLTACLNSVETNSEIYFYIKQYNDFWRSVDMSVKQVNECFSDKKQWETFCFLSPRQEEIRDSWLLKLKPALNDCFSPGKIVEGWEFYSSNDDYRWYLKEFGTESLCLVLWHGDDGNNGETTDFCLWANPAETEIKTIYQMLREKKYSCILEAFERKDWLFEDGSWGYVVSEKGNWIFGDRDDGNLDLNQIAWYANYKTAEFVSQIQRKVDAFLKNEKITKLHL